MQKFTTPKRQRLRVSGAFPNDSKELNTTLKLLLWLLCALVGLGLLLSMLLMTSTAKAHDSNSVLSPDI